MWRGFPLFILESLESGKVINGSGRSAVMQDPEGADFPWFPKSLNNLLEGPDGINENVSAVLMLGGADEATMPESVDAIRKVADDQYAAARAAGKMHADTRFFYAQSDASVASQIRKLTKTEGPCLIILDIPDNGGFYVQKLDAPLTPEAVQTMLAAHKAKTLERKQL